MATFSDRLKEAMVAQNLKQIDLVHIAAENNVKLGKSHVSQYVSGKTVPRNDILHFLADTLHVGCSVTVRKTLLVGKAAPLPQKLQLPLKLLALPELQIRELHRKKRQEPTKMITTIPKVLLCIHLKNHPSLTMYYTMSADRL